MRRCAVERAEPALPSRPQFAGHPAFDKGPAHRRRVGLKLLQFLDIFLRQGIGNGRQDLRHLHQRPLQAAKRLFQVLGMFAFVEVHAEIARAGEPGADTRHRTADAGITLHLAGQRSFISHLGHS